MKTNLHGHSEIIKQCLIEHVSPYLIVLFGSFAKGTIHADSDLDIAFLSEKHFSDYELFMLAQMISSIVGREVDLIPLDKASTVFQAQIVGTGEVIYCTDETKKMYFEMKALKQYAKLNECWI